MEREVIHQDRHEVNHTDLNNAQTWGREASQHLIVDAITSTRQFVGLAVTVRSATEIDVAPGRLYDGDGSTENKGKVYALTNLETINLLSKSPVQDQKWLAISVYGQEIETDIQTRDVLIDLSTNQTEPRQTAMEKRRILQTHIANGQESPTPEKPEPPTGYTLIAHVRMTSSGVQEIVLAEHLKLPNLTKMNTQVQSIQGWIDAATPRISTIQSDIAGLGQALTERATLTQAFQLGIEVAKLKERAELPDDSVFFGADHFLDAKETNIARSGYSARLDEGVRPIIVASETSALAIKNPIDPEATVTDSGHCFPKFSEVTRLRMENRKGELTINQYQFQTQQAIQRTMSRERTQYGETRSYCTNSSFWRNGVYDATTGIFRRNTGETWLVAESDRAQASINHGHIRLTNYWRSTYQVPYWDTVTQTHTVNGSILAQTVLMAQTGWLSSVELHFTGVDVGGGMTLMIVDAPQGQPDMNSVVAKLDLAANALSTGWTKITLPTPVFVQSGKRYAVVLVSGATHRVGFTEGTEYTQGVLLYAQDGSYFTEAADRDLMMRLNFCRFSTPRAIVQMQELQLVGGIADIDMLYESVVPDGCQLIWEYQIAGQWFPIASDTAENLATQPALLPLRAVFIGTTDIQPVVRLTDSQVVISRQGTSFVHFSTLRTLGTNSSEVRIRTLLEGFDDTYHTADCRLFIDGSPVAASSSRDTVVDGRSVWREYIFTLGSATDDYEIELTGDTNNWRHPLHVAERYDVAL